MSDRAIRVLLIDGHIEDSRWVQELLAEFGESRYGGGWMRGLELFHIERLNDALGLIGHNGASEQFDVVLLNPALRDSFGLHSFLRLQAQAPEIPVVILADDDDPELAVSMVRAGAQDFLVKMYAEGPALARALRLAVERNRITRGLRSDTCRDELTGLHNRNGFHLICETFLRSAARLQTDIAVVMVELSNLDGITASYGRSEEQLALVETADWLREASGLATLLARVEDNRFALAFVGAERLEDMERRFHVWRRKANRRNVEVRFGSAWFYPNGEGARTNTDRRLTCTDLLASAAQALWENETGSEAAPAIRSAHSHLAHSSRRNV